MRPDPGYGSAVGIARAYIWAVYRYYDRTMEVTCGRGMHEP